MFNLVEPDNMIGWTLSPGQTDNIFRELGRTAIGNLSSGTVSGDDPWDNGNKLFLLTPTPQYGQGPGAPIAYRWHEVRLSWANDPFDWHSSDISDELAAASPNGDNTSLGSCSLEAVRKNGNGPDNWVYVSYANSHRGNRTASDNYGLRVAVGEQTGADTFNWLTGGNDQPGYLIDSKYTYLGLTGDDNYGSLTTGLVDLRIKPSAQSEEASNAKLDKLGCAYILDGKVYLSESAGEGQEWTKVDANPGIPSNPIDSGLILWVKLAYRDDGHPYVLYCIRDRFLENGVPAKFHVRLWTP